MNNRHIMLVFIHRKVNCLKQPACPKNICVEGINGSGKACLRITLRRKMKHVIGFYFLYSLHQGDLVVQVGIHKKETILIIDPF